MQIVTVSLADRTYSIHIGEDLIGNPELLADFVQSDNVAVVTNETLVPLFLERVTTALRTLSKTVVEIVLRDGEAYKTAESLDVIYSALLAAKCDRKTTLIALGGGVVGDVAGFAAATYQRGIPFVQMPTTLLAQVDSSVGGKTAVNHRLGKNMIGAFHQPVAVLSDTIALKSLPAREYAAGFAEIIKHALIFDIEHLAALERDVALIKARDNATLARIVAHSCRIKADVVKRDERETQDIRALLNLGHTFGHAIETEMGYGVWLHGEAVAVGCVLAARLSQELGHLNAGDVARVERLFSAASLPIKPPVVVAEKMLEHMLRDKKNEGGKVTLVLLRKLGVAYVERAVSVSQIVEFWRHNGAL